jgi:hypothetical protein
MTSPAAASSLPRQRPFGVVVICAFLLLQAVIFAIGLVAIAQSAASNPDDVISFLKALGLNATFLSFADAVTVGKAILGGLLILTVAEMVLMFTLRRIGWIVTMLMVGLNLAVQLLSIWQGTPPATTSLLILSVSALYLNQAEVRAAFELGRGGARSVGPVGAGDDAA